MFSLSVPRTHSRRSLQTGITRAGRVAVMVMISALLAGCGQTLQTVMDTSRTIIRGGEQIRPVPAEVAASPYARLLVDDGFVRGTMVLGYDDDGRLSWHAGPHILFLCEGDQVCGTHNMGARLDEMRIEGHNPFRDLRAIGDAPISVERRYDWVAEHRYGVPVAGTLERKGEDVVEILERKRNLVRYEESLRGPGVTGTNVYWVDATTGRIWKSRQMLAPGIYANILVLKPYLRREQP